MNDELKFDPDALRNEFADYCTEVEPGIKAKAPRLNQLETLALIGMTVFQAAKELKHEKAASIAALEAANARIAELEAAAKATVEKDWRVGLFKSSSDPRKEVRCLADGINRIAEYEKHHSFIRWIDAAPAATDNGGGRDAVTDAQVEAALAAFNAFPCPMNGCISRSGNAEQMRAAIDAALSQKAGEQQ